MDEEKEEAKENHDHGWDKNGNANNYEDTLVDGKPVYTESGLKSKVRQSPFNNMISVQYEYASPNKIHYILAYHEVGTEGITYTHWSKYRYDSHELVEVEGYIKGRGENYVTSEKEFYKMLFSEKWVTVKHEDVVIQ
jgi:hypothetical protein